MVVKSLGGILLAAENVPGDATSTNINGLRPSTHYRVVVFGVAENGQPYKSLESVVATKEGMIMANCMTYFFVSYYSAHILPHL